jgi:flagellar biosynthesis protein FlhF
MSVQVFQGRTLTEAQRAAQKKLGVDAVVLTTRTIRQPGLVGWLAGTAIEIAAISAKHDAAPAPKRGAVPFAAGVYADRSASSHSDVAALRAELKGDIRTLKALIGKVDDSSCLAGELSALRELIESSMSAGASRGDKTAARIRALGIEGPAAMALARALKGKTLDADCVREALSQMIKAIAWPVNNERTLIALIGPSGVGKTTTVAKLAARARMAGRTATLVACDTFRVGAVDQLARYAELMGAELATARTADELRSVIDRARTDVVLVDTSGRPPAAEGVELGLTPAGSGRPGARQRHVLLCAPASIRAVDAARLAKRYGVVAPSALAITKLDETDAPAGLVHASWATKLPVSVLCFGHRVPEDIASATTGAILEYVAPSGAAKAAAA